MPPQPETVTPMSHTPAETFVNTSGQGSTAILPAELKGLNWGGLLWNWIWGLGNKTYIALLTFVPIVGWIMPFVLLFKGNEWAWQNKRWESIEHFKSVQRLWVKVWFIIFAVLLLIVIAGLVLSIGFVSRNVARDNTAESVRSESAGSQRAGSPAVSFDGQEYTLGYTNRDNGDFYEFYLPRETGENWTKLMTLISYPDNSMEDLNAMQIASNTVNLVEDGGGTVLERNVYEAGQMSSSLETYVLIYILPDPEQRAMEMNLQKFYEENGIVRMVGYGERIQATEGETAEQFSERVDARRADLFAMEDDFVTTYFEFPQ